MATLWVTQDGPDFYIYSDPDLNHLERTVTAPVVVFDWDLAAAQEARKWFEENGYFKGADEVRWPNPFGDS